VTPRTPWGSADASTPTRAERSAPEPETDRARAWRRVVHRAGCGAPKVADAVAVAFPPDAIGELEADGNGGERMRCPICGAVESPPGPPPVPARSAARVAEARRAIARLRRDGRRVTLSAVCAETGITRETLAGYARSGWVDLVG
jgi:hypothetical protein